MEAPQVPEGVSGYHSVKRSYFLCVIVRKQHTLFLNNKRYNTTAMAKVSTRVIILPVSLLRMVDQLHSNNTVKIGEIWRNGGITKELFFNRVCHVI